MGAQELKFGLAVEGCPIGGLDGVYARAGEWDGRPLYRHAAAGTEYRALYWCRGKDLWVFSTPYSALSAEQKRKEGAGHAYRAAAAGGAVPVGPSPAPWLCLIDDQWAERQVTVRAHIPEGAPPPGALSAAERQAQVLAAAAIAQGESAALLAGAVSGALSEPEPEAAAAAAADDPLAEELSSLKTSAIKKHARALGATGAQLDEVDDADDSKAAAIALVLSLRDGLLAMKFSALKKQVSLSVSLSLSLSLSRAIARSPTQALAEAATTATCADRAACPSSAVALRSRMRCLCVARHSRCCAQPD